MFLVEGDARVGWGHFSRADRLATALEEAGGTVSIRTPNVAEWNARHGGNRPARPVDLPSLEQELRDPALRPAALIIDGTRPGLDELRHLHAIAGATALVAIGNRWLETAAWFDLVVAQTLLPLPPPTPGRVLSGGPWVVLGDCPSSPPPGPDADGGKEVVISLGGSSAEAMWQELARHLREMPERESGPLHLWGRSGDDFAAVPGIREQGTGSDLRAMLGRADYAILSGGLLLMEAMACGCPALGVPLNQSQAERIEACAAEGLCGAWLPDSSGELPSGRLVAFRGEKERIREGLRRHPPVDDRGHERLAEELHRRFGGRP
jgi:hypothetical protein